MNIAAATLAVRGVTSRQLAERLGVTPQAISFHLAGRSATTPAELLDAVEALAGPEVGPQLRQEVAEAIAKARATQRAAS